MRIGILGSGLMGGNLGTIFARAGHEVVFSYARSKDKLNRLARRARRARDVDGGARTGEKHWHGATLTTAMTHIAIQEKKDGRVGCSLG